MSKRRNRNKGGNRRPRPQRPQPKQPGAVDKTLHLRQVSSDDAAKADDAESLDRGHAEGTADAVTTSQPFQQALSNDAPRRIPVGGSLDDPSVSPDVTPPKPLVPLAPDGSPRTRHDHGTAPHYEAALLDSAEAAGSVRAKAKPTHLAIGQRLAGLFHRHGTTKNAEPASAWDAPTEHSGSQPAPDSPDATTVLPDVVTKTTTAEPMSDASLGSTVPMRSAAWLAEQPVSTAASVDAPTQDQIPPEPDSTDEDVGDTDTSDAPEHDAMETAHRPTTTHGDSESHDDSEPSVEPQTQEPASDTVDAPTVGAPLATMGHTGADAPAVTAPAPTTGPKPATAQVPEPATRPVAPAAEAATEPASDAPAESPSLQVDSSEGASDSDPAAAVGSGSEPIADGATTASGPTVAMGQTSELPGKAGGPDTAPTQNLGVASALASLDMPTATDDADATGAREDSSVADAMDVAAVLAAVDVPAPVPAVTSTPEQSSDGDYKGALVTDDRSHKVRRSAHNRRRIVVTVAVCAALCILVGISVWYAGTMTASTQRSDESPQQGSEATQGGTAADESNQYDHSVPTWEATAADIKNMLPVLSLDGQSLVPPYDVAVTVKERHVMVTDATTSDPTVVADVTARRAAALASKVGDGADDVTWASVDANGVIWAAVSYDTASVPQGTTTSGLFQGARGYALLDGAYAPVADQLGSATGGVALTDPTGAAIAAGVVAPDGATAVSFIPGTPSTDSEGPATGTGPSQTQSDDDKPANDAWQSQDSQGQDSTQAQPQTPRQPSSTTGADNTIQPRQQPSGGASSATSPNDGTSSSSGASQPQTHTHNWQPVYATKWVQDRAEYDEIVQAGTKYVCSDGYTFGTQNGADGHVKDQAAAGVTVTYTTEPVYGTVHHDAQGHDEQYVAYYKCPVCGATKEP